jgi:predicted dehydrogenase
MINWGILGMGRMGMSFANAIKETSNSKLIATASNSGKVFGDFENRSYESLINDKNIDAIYIATINNSHVDLIKKIIETQKKILCEKPIATSLQSFLEVEKLMLDKKIKFYEGIAYYSHPQTIEVLNLIDNDEIGNIEKIESTFGFKARYRPSSRLYNKELGGGSILDLGCYPISFFMLFAKLQEKIFISNKKLNYAKSGVDDEATATLNYDNKFEGKIHVSIKSNLENSCTIYGSKGFIKVKEPWSPSNNDVIEISSKKHFYIKQIKSNLSVYANQIEKVSESFLNDNVKNNLFDIQKSSINMKLIDNWLSK